MLLFVLSNGARFFRFVGFEVSCDMNHEWYSQFSSKKTNGSPCKTKQEFFV